MAKKTIADLNIKLSAGTSGLAGDFNRASGMAKKYGADIQGIATKIAGFLAGAFAVSRITSGIRSQMQEIDLLAKTADRIGASVDQVQAIKMAADLAGVGVTELTGGLRRMSAVVDDAAQGMDTAALALTRVGLSAQQLRGMSPVEQLAAIVDGLQGVTDASERMALAQEILGRGGMAFLSLDAEQIRQAADDIDRLGLSMSRADAKQVEIANDAITRLVASMKGLYQELAISLAPVITSTAKGVTAFVAAINSLDSVTASNTVKLIAFAAGFSAVLILIPRIVAGIRTIILTMQALASAQAITSALAGPAGWAVLAIAAGVAAGGVASISTAFEGVTQAADEASGSAGKAAADIGKPFIETIDQVDAVAGAVDGVTKKMDALRTKADQIANEMRTPIEKFQDDMRELRELRFGELISTETFNRAATKYRTELEKALDVQEKITKLQQAEPAVAALQKGSSGAFSAIQQSAREWRDQMKLQQLQLAQQKNGNEILSRIDRNTRAQLSFTQVKI